MLIMHSVACEFVESTLQCNLFGMTSHVTHSKVMINLFPNVHKVVKMHVRTHAFKVALTVIR